MSTEDPAVQEWADLLHEYRTQHNHDTCSDCDPQALAETHVEACLRALEAKEKGEDVDSPAYAEFCGCLTCVVRETLLSAGPSLIAAVTRHPDPIREALQREFDR